MSGNKYSEITHALLALTGPVPLCNLSAAVGTTWAVTENQSPTHFFHVEKTANNGLIKKIKIVNAMNVSVMSMTRAEFKEIYRKLTKETYQTTDYGRVKDGGEWVSIFHKTVAFQFDRPNSPKPRAAVACTSCGIYLPVRNITVDHQAPQKRGKDLAILRVFRHLGYTKAGPSGRKKALNVGKTYGTGNITDRYTMNKSGALLYSAFKYGNNLPYLRQLCSHNLYNLTPMCNSCNSGKSNIFKGVRL